MIMGDDKRNSLASVILSKMKEGKVRDQELAPSESMGDDEDMDGLRTAMEDLLQAISDKDPQGMAMALKAAMQFCDPDDEPDEESK